MNAWESVQNTINWIEDNLSENIEIEGLAEMAHLSPFYYQRLFKRLVRRTAMDYIKLRRVANAAEYLAKNNSLIVDVAYSFGFQSHESFTRAFKEIYGITPEEYRKSPRPLSHFTMPDLSLNYYVVDEDVPLVADGIVLEVYRKSLTEARYFAGYSIQNPVNSTPGIDYLSELWSRFHKDKSSINDLKTGGNTLGVSFAGEKEGFFTYIAAAEITSARVQDGFVLWSLPEGEYAVCSFEAEDFYNLTTNALDKSRDYMLGVWLREHNLEIEPFMAELYYDTAPDSSMMEIWFKIK